MRWIIPLMAIFCLPFLVYVLSKAATWGRLQATKEFTQKHFVHKHKQYIQQEEQNNGKEEK